MSDAFRTLFPRTLEDMRDRVAELEHNVEAQDRFTDKHLYPSGINKLRDLRDDLNTARIRLDIWERHGLDPCAPCDDPDTRKRLTAEWRRAHGIRQ